jgi:hypothetical protein
LTLPWDGLNRADRIVFAMKRTLILGTAWTASAAAAVGLGFLAVSLVDASTSLDTRPVAATATATTPTGGASGAPSAPGATTASGEHATVGGTAYASCDGGTPSLAGAPSAGWWVDDSDDPGEVEFENGTQKVEVHVTCVDGSPRFSTEGPRADDSRREDHSATPTRTSASPGAPDDSDGRVGGGHGSDDPPGDDSAGRVGGGHGSDDGPGDDSADRERAGDSDDDSDDDSGRGRGRGRGSDD